MARNCAGATPSRLRNPCKACDTALRGLPSSKSRTFRRQRPSTKAAFSPAGPPPTMIASQRSVCFGDPLIGWFSFASTTTLRSLGETHAYHARQHPPARKPPLQVPAAPWQQNVRCDETIQPPAQKRCSPAGEATPPPSGHITRRNLPHFVSPRTRWAGARWRCEWAGETARWRPYTTNHRSGSCPFHQGLTAVCRTDVSVPQRCDASGTLCEMRNMQRESSFSRTCPVFALVSLGMLQQQFSQA